jgi:predicted Holliday junction resolvase-like endonuclease
MLSYAKIITSHRMQIQMQRVSLGEPWWAAKKKELYTRAQLEREAIAREQEEKEKKLEKRRQMKGRRKKDALAAISMDVRVRERMGKWRYALMPWRREAVAEEIEILDEMVAQLDG